MHKHVPNRRGRAATGLAMAWCGWALLAAPAAAQGSPQGAQLFNQRCSSCHTVGQGDRAGPDLLGVLDRREQAWLTSFIASPGKAMKEPCARWAWPRPRSWSAAGSSSRARWRWPMAVLLAVGVPLYRRYQVQLREWARRQAEQQGNGTDAVALGPGAAIVGAGHIVGLLLPWAVILWGSSSLRLVFMEVTGLVGGLLLAWGLARGLTRRVVTARATGAAGWAWLAYSGCACTGCRTTPSSTTRATSPPGCSARSAMARCRRWCGWSR